MNTYRNGNYLVSIEGETGTKLYTALRRGEDFNPEFPDAIDIKLTNMCYHGCSYCHEDSGPEGKHGNLKELKKILSLLPEVPIELSFGGGNILTFEDKELIDLFKWCRERNHRVGITLNYVDWLHFLSGGGKFKGLIDAVGVSVDSTVGNDHSDREDYFKLMNTHLKNWIEDFKIPMVYHFVLGTFTIDFFINFLKEQRICALGNGGDVDIKKKVLLLGYKQKGRGERKIFYPTEMYLKELRNKIIRDSSYLGIGAENTLSFDNLAITQLKMRSAFTTKEWESLYLGDDFTHSMYIDLPGRAYGPSSTSTTRLSFEDEKYKDNIVEYFKNEHN